MVCHFAVKWKRVRRMFERKMESSETTPLVSVLLPCYNHEAYVISSLESVAASDYRYIELIFIDDASKDDSFNLATRWFEKNRDRFVRVVCVQHEKNRGICATFNELYALSRGEYINYLASDDNLLPDGLSRQVSFAIRHGVDFVFSDFRLIDEAGELISESAFRYFGKDSRKLKRNVICLTVDIIFYWTPPWNKHFFRASLLKRIGMFDASLRYEDRDFIMRVLIDGSFALLSESTANYRIRLSNPLTPGLVIEDVWGDFRKADCKNYLTSRGVIRFLLGLVVYSYPEKYIEMGLHNAQLIWLITKLFGLVKRVIHKVHKELVR